MSAGRGVRASACAALALSVAAVARAEPPPGASLEGFTGYLATPSAWIAEPGTVSLLAANARVEDRSAWIYAVTLGFLRWAEIAGRVTHPADRFADLSFNFKLQVPLDLLAPGLPIAIAAGGQDVGGAAPHFRSWYGVGSLRLWRVTASLGWGSGPDRMDGVFAGASFALADWLELLADYDAAVASGGARLSVPLTAIGLPVRLGGVARTVLTSGPRRVEWGATLDVPLWMDAGPRGRTPPPDVAPGTTAPSGPEPAPGAPPIAAAGELEELGRLRALEDSLVEIGLEEVRAGRDGDLLVVEYENNRFNRAEADGLQVVAREIRRSGLRGAVAVVMKKNGLRVAEILLPAPGGEPGPGAPRWTFDPSGREAVWASPRPRNRRALHASLVLAPGLSTFIATEAGVFEWILSFRPDLVLPFWPGATAFARADVPLAWSKQFTDTGLLRPYRDDPRVEYALVHQAIPLGSGLMAMVGAGLYRTTSWGGLGELRWAPGRGAIEVGVQGAWTADGQEQHRSVTVSALAWLWDTDLLATVRGGQFYFGDRGATVDLSRWFGDVQVGLFFTHTDVSIAGGFVTLPLTPRRDMRPGWIQVRGASRWGYDVATTVGAATNDVRIGLAVPPIAPWNLEQSYLDSGRVSQASFEEALGGIGPAAP